MKVWTSDGWKIVKRSVRHKTEKYIYGIRTKHAIVDVTEDHSLLDKNRETIKPCDLIFGEELLHNHMAFGKPQKDYNKSTDKIYNMEAETFEQKRMFINFFAGDGTSRIYKYSKIKLLLGLK